MKKLNYLLLIVTAGLLILLGVWIGRGAVHPGEDIIVETTDTIYETRVDTILVPKPFSVLEYDTIFQTDTLLVPGETIMVPITTKLYEQTDLYKASVTGYRATLDYIEVYPKTVTEKIYTDRLITKYKDPRFSLGVQVGAGYSTKFTPYIGIGVQYNIINFK